MIADSKIKSIKSWSMAELEAMYANTP